MSIEDKLREMICKKIFGCSYEVAAWEEVTKVDTLTIKIKAVVRESLLELRGNENYESDNYDAGYTQAIEEIEKIWR